MYFDFKKKISGELSKEQMQQNSALLIEVILIKSVSKQISGGQN